MALDFQAIGLLCRTMADLDLMLAALGGPDRRDPASINLPPLEPPKRTLRIGWFTHIGNETVDEAVDGAHRQGREVLASLGHKLEECDPPFDIGELRAVWSTLTVAGAARAALTRQRWKVDATDQIVGLTKKGAAMLAVDYVRAVDRLQVFRADVSSHWGEFDALLLPTTAAPAWPVGLDCPETIGGKLGTGDTQAMFCGWVNAMGFAGLNLPGQPHTDGRPIGLQIVAPFGLDGVALEIGRQFEARAPWAQRWPALAGNAP